MGTCLGSNAGNLEKRLAVSCTKAMGMPSITVGKEQSLDPAGSRIDVLEVEGDQTREYGEVVSPAPSIVPLWPIDD